MKARNKFNAYLMLVLKEFYPTDMSMKLERIFKTFHPRQDNKGNKTQSVTA